MSRLLVTQLVLLACAVHAGSAPSLAQSARHFGSCAVGSSDVDVAALVDATRAYCTLLRSFGVFTAGSIQQVNACLRKVENGRQTLIDSAPSGRRAKLRKACRSMKGLLVAEASVHQKGGVLADPSAAMGLLWVRRGLAFWARVFDLEAKRLLASGCKPGAPGTLLEQTTRAYQIEIASFHGWVSRNGFMVSVRAAPEWDELCTRAALPTEPKKLADELRKWARVLDALVGRMKALQVKHDMEDRRRTV